MEVVKVEYAWLQSFRLSTLELQVSFLKGDICSYYAASLYGCWKAAKKWKRAY